MIVLVGMVVLMVVIGVLANFLKGKKEGEEESK